jgi:hypothetical protein
MGAADLAEHEVDRALVDFDLGAIDQHRIERLGQITADGAADPVVLGRHRASEPANPRGQGRPDEDHVEVAGVIGEVDPLTGVGLRFDPAHAGPADGAGDPGE